MKMSWEQETERNSPPDYVAITCGQCGLRFFVPRIWDQGRRQDHRSFVCMNGHTLTYTGENEAEKLRRERDRLRQEIARVEETTTEWQRQAQENARQASAAKAQVTKIKKRVGHGVCPCCNRTFGNLAAHIAQKHPTFTAEAAE